MGSLVIEVSETALQRATPATVAALRALDHLGVRIAIDNFGTGFFSLDHLRQFPVHALKIAGEFTRAVEPDQLTDARSPNLAAAVVALARLLGIETVAEAIETATQADSMRSAGCTYGQGFYFDRPMARGDPRGGPQVVCGARGSRPARGGSRHSPRTPRKPRRSRRSSGPARSDDAGPPTSRPTLPRRGSPRRSARSARRGAAPVATPATTP